MTDRSGVSEVRERIARLRTWLKRLLIWRVWERMLEIEFLDRSIALAGKAFVSFFPLVIVVAAFVPGRAWASIISAIAARLGLRGDAFSLVKASFASSDDIRRATGLLGLVLTISSRPRSPRHCSVSTSAHGDDRRTPGSTPTGGE